MNPLFQQMNSIPNRNPMIERIKQFKQAFSGDPQQMVQQMLNSGKVSQAQMNQYIQQANELYRLMK